MLERAAAREGRALRDVIAAVDVICKGGAQAKVVPGAGSAPKQVTLQQFGELWPSGELAVQLGEGGGRLLWRATSRPRAVLASEQKAHGASGYALVLLTRNLHRALLAL
ncbi:uncharacterized protein SOCE26_074540 [Sorangium cellulosum]|uniref:Uncharacterized protein n=1 Tax=Sorangium cellulosum TaxID=56 RepID=A0A2L0F317_SORCE|nr:hypothetical protein [Sorangium cellulosum]AUX45952.1 uncharacterized protein SOCE26_074540 [Sorangium cellulosum]